MRASSWDTDLLQTILNASKEDGCAGVDLSFRNIYHVALGSSK